MSWEQIISLVILIIIAIYVFVVFCQMWNNYTDRLLREQLVKEKYDMQMQEWQYAEDLAEHERREAMMRWNNQRQHYEL